ncbi:MAG: Fic family protein [Aestuariivita sp.]|nr:Fic family protein [Aestuariivita sp.]
MALVLEMPSLHRLPVDYLMNYLDSFEKFLHDDVIQLLALVRAALVDLQFETIHPFLDGNGRLAWLLIERNYVL